MFFPLSACSQKKQHRVLLFDFLFCLSILLFGIFCSAPVFAEEDLFFDEDSFRVVPEQVLQGETIKIYISLKNSSSEDMKGVVRAFDVTEEKKVEVEQTFTALGNSRGDVFFQFTPEVLGTHEVAFRLIPWEVYTGNDNTNDKIVKTFFVDIDTDGDGIGNAKDLDDDNDSVVDTIDAFPLNSKESKDFDKDGIGNNADMDDDNDSIPDADDGFPFDAAEANDTDGDKIGDNEDEDDDGDGIRDDAELNQGTDPQKKDTDGDGVDDGMDNYPLEKKFQFDTDKDGEPNAKDLDDDNDGVSDHVDLFPLDKNEWSDFDKDGVGDFSDQDDDNDGLLDREEKEQQSNPFDSDTDKDGVKDGDDDLPIDPTETQDSDNDGVGDNADINDNNKGPVLLFDNETKIFSSARNEPFVLELKNSYDPEGGELSFLWEVLGEDDRILAVSEQDIFEVKFSGVGEKRVRVIARDEEGEERQSEFVVEVYWSQNDIIWGIGIVVFLHVLAGMIYWKKRKKTGIIRQK